MSYRWDPWGEMAALQRDVQQLLGRGAGAQTQRAGGAVPPIDAFNAEDALVVRVELPGMSPGEVDVTVHEGVLTVSGERKLESGISEDQWVRRERAVGRFERSFTLPDDVDPGNIAASFTNGILELRIPHPPERKPHRIPVGGREEKDAIDVGS